MFSIATFFYIKTNKKLTQKLYIFKIEVNVLFEKGNVHMGLDNGMEKILMKVESKVMWNRLALTMNTKYIGMKAL